MPNPEQDMSSMVPDIDLINNLLTNQHPNWVSITFRGIGEMEDQPAVGNVNPAMSWIDLSQETDQWVMRCAYVNGGDGERPQTMGRDGQVGL
jgi:hypothetical protein